MPWAICRKRCYDGKLGRLYYIGDVVEDMPLKHPLASSFEFKKTAPVVEEAEEETEIEEEQEVEGEQKRKPGRPKKE